MKLKRVGKQKGAKDGRGGDGWVEQANTVKCAYPSLTSKGPKYTLNSVKLGGSEAPLPFEVPEVVDVSGSLSEHYFN